MVPHHFIERIIKVKVSVFLTTYNKNSILPNTLYSISKQKTSFPLEICIVDDCSAVDPKPIIDKYLPSAKYLRLPSNEGFLHAKVHCLDLVSKDTDIIIIHHVDVVLLQEFAYAEIVKHIMESTVVFTEVRDFQLPTCMHKNYGTITKQLLSNWDTKLTNTYIICTGAACPAVWLFYLGGIFLSDLEKIDYRVRSCDAAIAPKMRKAGYEAKILKYVRSVHQLHPKVVIPCSDVEVCDFYCSRTQKAKGLKPDNLFFKKATIIGER